MKQYPLQASTIITIGFPFIIYKALMGYVAIKTLPSPVSWIAGIILLGMAAVDLVMNLLNLGGLVLLRRPLTDTCLLAWLFNRFLGRQVSPKRRGHPVLYSLGGAVDTLLSFSLVAMMVGLNLFGYLSTSLAHVWSMATVTNILGAGLARTSMAIREARDKHLQLRTARLTRWLGRRPAIREAAGSGGDVATGNSTRRARSSRMPTPPTLNHHYRNQSPEQPPLSH